jgi:hypothetical protein
MTLPPSHFDNRMPLPPGVEPSSLQYETYSEMAKTRAAAQASVAFQALQTGLLMEMQGTMQSIGFTMDDIRQNLSDTLAIQQEMLKRDQVQAQLEEFIYQSEILVRECSKKESDVPYSSRYFLLQGVISTVQKNGIGTSVIRGRENKAAFDKVVRNINSLQEKLRGVKEVQEALAWAEEEAKRQQLRQRELEKMRHEEEMKRQEKVTELRRELASLGNSRKVVTVMDSLKKTIAKFENWGIPPKEGTPRKVVLGILICVAPFFIWCVPIFAFALYLDASQQEAKLNVDVDSKMNEIAQKLQELGEDLTV